MHMHMHMHMHNHMHMHMYVPRICNRAVRRARAGSARRTDSQLAWTLHHRAARAAS
jgi:hypothetical protein